MNRLKEYGVLLSIGCDGSATNDGSNMLDCIRTAYMLSLIHISDSSRYVISSVVS